jgi:hypothetical protein
VHVNARLENGEFVTAEVPRGQNHFKEGEAVWIHWREADEMRF